MIIWGKTVRSLNVLSSETDKSGSQKHRSKTQYSGRFIIRSPTPVNSEWELNQSLFDIFVAIGQSKPQTYDRCVSSPRAKVPHSRCHESIVGRNAHIRMPILTLMLLAHVLLNITGTRYKIVVFAPAWSKNRHDTQTFYLCLMHNRLSWRTDKIFHQNSGKLHIHAWFLPGMV